MIRHRTNADSQPPNRKNRFASVVIPAYEEEATILPIIRTALSHPLVGEVIVVSDGSKDGTADAARETEAIVIEFCTNRGKGSAMDAGVRRASNETIVFLDADTVGLTHSHLSALIVPVLSGRCDMFTLRRDRWFHLLPVVAPSLVIGGERALTKRFWKRVPANERSGFDVEIALNYYAKMLGKRTGTSFARGLKQTIKEKKRGLLRGFVERTAMTLSCARSYVRLYFLEPQQSVLLATENPREGR
jgi:hypothetical protein